MPFSVNLLSWMPMGSSCESERAADGPQAGVLVVREFVVGHRATVTGGCEADADAVLDEMVAIQQGLAGILGNVDSDVARGMVA